MINTVYFSLGSNLGRRKDNLNKAIKFLAEAGVKILKISSIYETEPVSKIKQGDFLNICIQAETELLPEKLLKLCKTIEKQMGRKPHRINRPGFYEPRIIDIDIILYGQKIIHKRNLQIPHKNMHLRRFVLEPLNEIAPNAYNPIKHKTVKELLKECKDKAIVMPCQTQKNSTKRRPS
jgi:2-amino-4-hydroxy-6-hydroxymethyldihydropteridine diphosphokinase